MDFFIMMEQFLHVFGRGTVLILFFIIPIRLFYRIVWKYFLHPKIIPNTEFDPDPESWAIVTGCTNGIGVEFATQLAGRGYNLCLISRNQNKLDQLRDQLLKESSNQIKIMIISFDFNSTDYSKLHEELEKVPRVDVLVNNVGAMVSDVSCPEFFIMQSAEACRKLIDVNILSGVHLSYIILPKMMAQRKGIILNLSSILGVDPVPLFGEYSATKRFIDFFSRSLAIECGGKGVTVRSLVTGGVDTRLNPFSRSLFAPKAKDYVQSVLRATGGESRASGHWAHEVLFAVYDWIPPMSLWPDTNVVKGCRAYYKMREEIYHHKNQTVTYGSLNDLRTDVVSSILKYLSGQSLAHDFDQVEEPSISFPVTS